MWILLILSWWGIGVLGCLVREGYRNHLLDLAEELEDLGLEEEGKDDKVKE
jgi:hypothetical protein